LRTSRPTIVFRARLRAVDHRSNRTVSDQCPDRAIHPQLRRQKDRAARRTDLGESRLPETHHHEDISGLQEGGPRTFLGSLIPSFVMNEGRSPDTA
jgi:hypothetical protein